MLSTLTGSNGATPATAMLDGPDDRGDRGNDLDWLTASAAGNGVCEGVSNGWDAVRSVSKFENSRSSGEGREPSVEGVSDGEWIEEAL